jgi:hypothetical protein
MSINETRGENNDILNFYHIAMGNFNPVSTWQPASLSPGLTVSRYAAVMHGKLDHA